MEIRSRVIKWWQVNWYMAGHKYVSSTEQYQLNNPDKLQEQINKYHPPG